MEHEVDGLYAITGSAIHLADQILRILQNDLLAKKLRENALSKVQNLYDWQVIANQTVEVYETVTRKSLPAAGGGSNDFPIERQNRLS